MKSTKDLLKETFNSVPNTFAYREVKFHIYHALQKLESLEKKAESKKKQEEINRQEKKKVPSWAPPIYQEQLHTAINLIDKMIDEEKKVIEEIRNKDKGQTIKDEPADDDELQTFHE